MHQIIALFGESEKGKFHHPYFCLTLIDLAENLGEPPRDSLGLNLAIQAVLYEKEVIFFRVKEEGFSTQDYLKGFEYLNNKINKLDAICLPKVGNFSIIDKLGHICKKHKSLIITTEKDLFDYLISIR